MPNPDATQPNLQAAEDLERALVEIDLNWHAEDAPPEPLNTDFARLVHRHWPTIRTALRERRELREALEKFDAAVDNYVYGGKEGGSRERMDTAQVMAGARRRIKALLAQPAAGKEAPQLFTELWNRWLDITPEVSPDPYETARLFWRSGFQQGLWRSRPQAEAGGEG